MRERPILMSAPMVRAILAGTKTQTRRKVKGVPLSWLDESGFHPSFVADPRNDLCPYGDRLWVREMFSGPNCMDATVDCAAAPPSKWGKSSRIWYWADGNPPDGDWSKPRPSIFMPRWASRITLEITDVRVERLQEISEADCVAEGIETTQRPYGIGYRDYRGAHGAWFTEARTSYQSLWKSINGAGSWDANPWVWAISFRRIGDAT